VSSRIAATISGGQARRAGVLLVLARRQVVAVQPPALLAREPGGECPAVRAERDALGRERDLSAHGVGPLLAIGSKDGLNVALKLTIDDGRVQSGHYKTMTASAPPMPAWERFPAGTRAKSMFRPLWRVHDRLRPSRVARRILPDCRSAYACTLSKAICD
jgi:hypothetical protein